jgi:hypothetical protein
MFDLIFEEMARAAVADHERLVARALLKRGSPDAPRERRTKRWFRPQRQLRPEPRNTTEPLGA